MDLKFWRSWRKHPDQDTSASLDGQKSSEMPALTGAQADSPIATPDQDLFGTLPFARAIAASIKEANASDGIAIAVNGPWGSGKSSVINLALHELKPEIDAGRLATLSFNPWWFSGREALTASFFQELQASIGRTLSEQARKSLANLGTRLSSAGPLIGGLASLALANPAAGAATSGGLSLFEKLTKIDTTVEQEYRKVAEALRGQDKTFVVVIDDIDRLSTDDALEIFRLIKSVGRLPRVIYLLAFDRKLAEDMIAARFPAEGTSYLEKVIQASFDLPVPDHDDLCNQIFTACHTTFGSLEQPKVVRFMNLFHDGVAPYLKTPRDTVRLTNAINISWPPIATDVDCADFLALEAMRVFRPSLYDRVRRNFEMLTGIEPSGMHESTAKRKAEFDAVFPEGLSERDATLAKLVLRRLFPKLDRIWANIWHNGGPDWQKDRRVCSQAHFHTYFRLGIGADQISQAESDEMVARAGTAGATATYLRTCVATPRRRQGTRAAPALEELRIRAADIPESAVPTFLADLFAVADELDVDADARKGFSIGDNQLRIHWLTNGLLRDRFPIDIRSKLVQSAMPQASLSWAVHLSSRCKQAYDKGEEGREHEPLVTPEVANAIYDEATLKLSDAAESGELEKHKDLIALLYRWRERGSEEVVKSWTFAKMASDEFIETVAQRAISHSWSHGLGFDELSDRVAQRNDYVDLEGLSRILDTEHLLNRLTSLLTEEKRSEESRMILSAFMNAPKKSLL